MIDAHAHLTDERLAGEVEAVLARAAAAGVEAVVTIGTDVADSRAALDLALRFDALRATAGIHPHAASSADEAALAEVRELAAHPRVVAIGETGLDYHYDLSPRDAQRAAFVRHLEMAAELRLPVVVHSRQADGDLGAMVREHGPSVAGVLHSFAGGRPLMEAALEAGWYVSFSGMITFRRYEGADLVRAVPADRLLVETDSPYLAPVPYRGKRNEPAYVAAVAARAAELRGEPLEELRERTARNARRFYALEG